MSESPISLRDETGVERFRGTQSPGGGSQPLSWATCTATYPGPDPFTASSFFYQFLAADLAIVQQSADNEFSVGTVTDPYPEGGAILGKSGGVYMASAFFGSPVGTLDGGSAKTRYAAFGITSGDLNSTGLDISLPVVISGDAAPVQCMSAMPGVVSEPGGPAAYVIAVIALGMTGTDSIPADQFNGLVFSVVRLGASA